MIYVNEGPHSGGRTGDIRDQVCFDPRGGSRSGLRGNPAGWIGPRWGSVASEDLALVRGRRFSSHAGHDVRRDCRACHAALRCWLDQAGRSALHGTPGLCAIRPSSRHSHGADGGQRLASRTVSWPDLCLQGSGPAASRPPHGPGARIEGRTGHRSRRYVGRHPVRRPSPDVPAGATWISSFCFPRAGSAISSGAR